MSKNYLEEIAKISEGFDEQKANVLSNYEKVKKQAGTLVNERDAFVKELEALLEREDDNCTNTFNELSNAGLVSFNILDKEDEDEENEYEEDEDEEDEYEEDEYEEDEE